MPPRASTSKGPRRDDDYVYDDDEADDFVAGGGGGGGGEDDDSGDDFLMADDGDFDDGRHFAAARRKAAKSGRGKASAAATAKKKGALGGPSKDAGKSYAWESSFQRSWDVVGEDQSGSLEASVKHLLAQGKRKRAAREERRVRRGIIRHLVLVIDDSENMNEKDGGRGTRLDLLLPIARRFVSEYFEQNPIGQLAILAMRDGVADRLVPMGGNTADHLAALSPPNRNRRLEPRGDPSLQNALEMARSTLAHLPTTSSREVLLLSGSLTSCDPGNIHQTVAALKAAGIRVDLIHLSAEMKILRDIAQETGGTFGVALNEGHLEDLVREGVRPREIVKKEESASRRVGDEDEDGEDDTGAELMQMGFPLRLPTHAPPTLCACHAKLYPPAGFLCPRCGSKLCDVPTDCAVCGLTVVMSTHLARSYRHLFPVRRWVAVSWEELARQRAARRRKWQRACLGCDEVFPPLPEEYVRAVETATLATSSRYECPKCGSHFCLECDSYTHEELYVCPGC
ncbi:TFIIH basal transcription factor complex, subunit SSL1, partial [Jaminaea rosea]